MAAAEVHSAALNKWADAEDAYQLRFSTTASIKSLTTYGPVVVRHGVSFAGSNRLLKVEFDAIYTAEEIGSDKPSQHNFDYMLERLATLGHEKGDILHIAQSLFHDHVPAKRAGLASAWIDRRHDKDGWDATPRPEGQASYDLRFTSLVDMVAAHAAERRNS